MMSYFVVLSLRTARASSLRMTARELVSTPLLNLAKKRRLRAPATVFRDGQFLDGVIEKRTARDATAETQDKDVRGVRLCGHGEMSHEVCVARSPLEDASVLPLIRRMTWTFASFVPRPLDRHGGISRIFVIDDFASVPSASANIRPWDRVTAQAENTGTNYVTPVFAGRYDTARGRCRSARARRSQQWCWRA